MLRHLDNDNSFARASIVLSLFRFSNQEEVLYAILSSANDPNYEVRLATVETICRIRYHNDRYATNNELFDTLIMLTTDSSAEVRAAACRAFWAFDSTPESIEALTNRLTDEDQSVRNAAEEELSKLTNESE